MKLKYRVNQQFRIALMISFFFVALINNVNGQKSISIESQDGLNKITLELDQQGRLYYQVRRRGDILVEKSRLGLIAEDQDFSSDLAIYAVSPVTKENEKYSLEVSNFKEIDHSLNKRSVTLKTSHGSFVIVDIVAGKEGVAFRYRFPEENSIKERVIENELTEFRIDTQADGWLMPYNLAGQYTPAYEDFYFKIKPGETVSDPRNSSSGWCMPALFNVNKRKRWILIAESSSEDPYPGTHFSPDDKDGVYKIQFANDDERYNLPIAKDIPSKPRFSLPWRMPWRVIITGDNAGEILLSSLITDVAPPSRIEDPSWIKAGKASWSWWSHPDDQSADIYKKFIGLADTFGWSYTLFDAGWEKANRAGHIVDTALSRGINPLVWGYSADYFTPESRRKKFKEYASMGIKGVKIDFWCSDRQEALTAMQGVFEDAAKEKLLVNLHGATVPRGWQRTWPNFVSAEAILGTESYFYEPRFPEKAAGQNTILPFTRNVAGPADYTPFALTLRKFKRMTTAVHELATCMIYTSGIIHFADSYEVFERLPSEVKSLFKEMPATWDDTKAVLADPGKVIVLTRKKDSLSYIVGINGTDNDMPIKIDLEKYANGARYFRLISEGDDPAMDFYSKDFAVRSDWTYDLKARGGFIIRFIK